MNPYTMKEICERAIQSFGIDSQIIKTMEECGELIQVLAKRMNKYTMTAGRYVDDHIAEELADVQIMIWQLQRIFPNDEWLSKKLTILEGRIPQEEEYILSPTWRAEGQ